MFIEYLQDALDFVRKDRKRALIVSLIIFGVVASLFGVLGQFIILLMVAAAVVLAFFVGEFELKKFGVELVTFITVLTGFLYGPMVGLIIGTFLLIIHFILARSLGPYVIYCVPTMAVIGLLAGYAGTGGWFGGDVALVGIILSLIYNLITGGLGTIMFGDFFDELLWSGTNFALNFILFLKIAPMILTVLT